MSSSPHKSLSPQHATVSRLFARLKMIRNLSLGVSALGSGLALSARSRRETAPLVGGGITLAVLALLSAGTAQILLRLNQELEQRLNQPVPDSPAEPIP